MSQTFQPALRPQSRSLQKRNTVTGWLFILPNLIGFCAFTLVPVLMSIVMSFSDWNGFGAFHFTGLENYRIIFSDSSFRIALWNTVVFAVFNVLIVMVLSFLLAMLLNRHLIGRNLLPCRDGPLGTGQTFSDRKRPAARETRPAPTALQ